MCSGSNKNFFEIFIHMDKKPYFIARRSAFPMAVRRPTKGAICILSMDQLCAFFLTHPVDKFQVRPRCRNNSDCGMHKKYKTRMYRGITDKNFVESVHVDCRRGRSTSSSFAIRPFPACSVADANK